MSNKAVDTTKNFDTRWNKDVNITKENTDE